MLAQFNGWPAWARSALVTLLIAIVGYLTFLASWFVQDWYERSRAIEKWSVEHEAMSSQRLNTHEEAIESWTKILNDQIEVDTEMMLQIEELRGEYKVLRDRSDTLREERLNRRP